MRQQRRALATGGPIAPNSLPNLELRLSGTSLAGTDDTNIALWPDLSGHGRDAAQASATPQPKTSIHGNANNPDSPTNRKGANFNFGEIDRMDGTMTDVGVAAGNTVYLWFWESPFSVNGQVIFQDQSGGAPQLIVSDASGGKVGWRDGAATNLSTLGFTGVGAYHSLVYVFAPPSGGTGVGTIYHNGTAVYTHTWSYNTASVTGYRIGANQVNQVPFGGILYELDYFSQAHSPDIVSRVLAWGTGFWGF